MIQFCYFLFYLFESITCYIFFENSYTRKQEPDYWKHRAHVAYPAVFLISYAVHFIELPFLNLIVFLIGAFFIALFCYETKLKSAVFMSGLLTAFMLMSELIVVSFSSVFLGEELPPVQDSEIVLVTQGGFSKLVYFVLVFVTAKVFTNKERLQKSDQFLIALAFLPLSSVIILNFIFYYELVHGIEEPYNTWLAVSTVLLLVANIVVFAVYDFVQRTNNENLFLQIDNIKSKARIDYYEMLMSQYEDRNILVHDIKRHLASIEAAAQNGDSEGVARYIDTIRTDFGLDDRLRFSGNRMLDVIIHRYDNKCKGWGIYFTAEARSVPDDFINEVDMTALIDNLLENAAESARKSEKHEVYFFAERVNHNFLTVNIKNSCDEAPLFDKNGTPISMKKGKNHGWGTKSINKVLKKYDGEMKYKYREDEKQFELELMIKV